jgi:hypothetical protein
MNNQRMREKAAAEGRMAEDYKRRLLEAGKGEFVNKPLEKRITAGGAAQELITKIAAKDAPPEVPNYEADAKSDLDAAQREAEKQRKPRGRAATMLTSGTGLSDIGLNLARRTLLGS